MNTKELVETLKAVYGDRYSYDNVYYVNAYRHIKLVCPKHGEFLTVPKSVFKIKHLCVGCKKDAKSFKYIEMFKKIHGDRYDYEKVWISSRKDTVEVICKEHGLFTQSADAHLKGYGCQHCAGNKKMNTATFIEKAKEVYGNKYNYGLVNYTNIITKVTIVCQYHGTFEQTPRAHLYGYGCKHCANKTEEHLRKLFPENKIDELTATSITTDRVVFDMPENSVRYEGPSGNFEVSPFDVLKKMFDDQGLSYEIIT